MPSQQLNDGDSTSQEQTDQEGDNMEDAEGEDDIQGELGVEEEVVDRSVHDQHDQLASDQDDQVVQN